MKVKIIKSEIPIIWIDTSIITVMTQWKNDLCRLDSVKEERISKLYNQIYDNTRKGKLICPLADQEQEIWIERDKWLDTINTLSLGIESLALQSIQDNQLCIFMKSFIKNEQEIILSYKNAFHSDPASELKEALTERFIITVNKPVLFGEDYQRSLKAKIHNALNDLREINVKSNVSFEEQLEKECLGELEALISLQKQFLSGQFKNDEERNNATWGSINLNMQLEMWESISGKSLDFSGLIGFYKSSYNRGMPYTNLSSNLFAHSMTDKQPIRSGDMMDIQHISTLMPFSNIFITDKAMSTFLRKRKFDKQYQTTVCYIGDTEIIDKFFSNL